MYPLISYSWLSIILLSFFFIIFSHLFRRTRKRQRLVPTLHLDKPWVKRCLWRRWPRAYTVSQLLLHGAPPLFRVLAVEHRRCPEIRFLPRRWPQRLGTTHVRIAQYQVSRNWELKSQEFNFHCERLKELSTIGLCPGHQIAQTNCLQPGDDTPLYKLTQSWASFFYGSTCRPHLNVTQLDSGYPVSLCGTARGRCGNGRLTEREREKEG